MRCRKHGGVVNVVVYTKNYRKELQTVYLYIYGLLFFAVIFCVNNHVHGCTGNFISVSSASSIPTMACLSPADNITYEHMKQ